jgi:hypothetical protein
MNERWIWTQKGDIGPSPRYGHAMAYEAARQRVVLFGGSSFVRPRDLYFDDTWEWDGTEWTQIADTGPSEREWPAMVFDSSSERLVLFGGFAPTAWLGDTWEWSEDAGWVKSQDMGPGSIGYPAMASTKEHTVLRAGQNTWEWDGSLWTQR